MAVGCAADEGARFLLHSWVEESFDARVRLTFLEERTGEVSLHVEVNGENAKSAFLADRCEEPDSMGLAHSSFQVEDGEDSSLAGQGCTVHAVKIVAHGL